MLLSARGQIRSSFVLTNTFRSSARVSCLPSNSVLRRFHRPTGLREQSSVPELPSILQTYKKGGMVVIKSGMNDSTANTVFI